MPSQLRNAKYVHYELYNGINELESMLKNEKDNHTTKPNNLLKLVGIYFANFKHINKYWHLEKSDYEELPQQKNAGPVGSRSDSA